MAQGGRERGPSQLETARPGGQAQPNRQKGTAELQTDHSLVLSSITREKQILQRAAQEAGIRDAAAAASTTRQFSQPIQPLGMDFFPDLAEVAAPAVF